MRKTLTFLGAAFAFLIASACYSKAADRPHHSGFYVGGNIGGDVNLVTPELGPLNIDSLAASGITGGGIVGYDARFGFLLAGVFGQYNFGSTEFSVAPSILSIQLKNDWRIGGRVGVAVDRLLVYVPVYYTQGDAEGNIAGLPLSIPTLKGWGAGAGLEYALNEHISFGAEYTMTAWRDIPAGPANLSTDDHRVVARIVLRPFN